MYWLWIPMVVIGSFSFFVAMAFDSYMPLLLVVMFPIGLWQIISTSQGQHHASYIKNYDSLYIGEDKSQVLIEWVGFNGKPDVQIKNCYYWSDYKSVLCFKDSKLSYKSK